MISTEPRFRSQVAGYEAKRRRRQLWRKIVSALACVVVFCTTYALILPAITMETPRVLDCPLTVHAHTADCYDADGNLICGQADFVVHTHNRSCYDEDGNLVCTLPEIEAHEHAEDCYTEVRTLICTEEEDPGHVHTEECYAGERILICGEEEDPGHEHTEECYTWTEGKLICDLEEGDSHRHGKYCYDWIMELTCPETERPPRHIHTDDCYEQRTLICTREEGEAHWHEEDCYEWTMELTCPEDEREPRHIHTDACYETQRTLLCEETDPDHEHTEDCYTEERVLACGEEEDFGHTHTAECYTRTQGDLICGLEEGEGHEHGEDCYVWAAGPVCGEEEREPGHLHTDECYMVETVLTCEKEEIFLHTHTDECYDEDGALICGQLEILEHVHTDACFREAEPEEETVYTYEDNTVTAEVALPADSTVPEDAVLTVWPITEEDEDYDYETLTQWASDAVDGVAAQIVLYDISFYTTEGEYLPVDDAATVSMRFKESVLSEGAGQVSVLHYPEEEAAPVALADVDVERDENDALSALTFQTEGFSVFAVVKVTEAASSDYEAVAVPDDLNGQSFIIGDTNGTYAITYGTSLTTTTDMSTASVWTFESTGSGTYYISSGGTYLRLSGNTLTTSTTNRTAFTVTYVNDTQIQISANNRYIRINNGTLSASRTASSLSLYQEVKSSEEEFAVTNLGGKEFAIVNLNNASRQYAMTSTVGSGQENTLKGVPVTVSSQDGTTYVSGDDITIWEFIATGTPGVYYIKAKDSGEYLHIESGESLTLSSDPQEITVTTYDSDSGQVILSATASNGTTQYINWIGSNSARGDVFGTWSGIDANSAQTLCQVVTGGLFYDLNLPSLVTEGNGTSKSWYNNTTPALTSTSQSIADGMTLYKPTASFDELGIAGEIYAEQHPGTADTDNPYYGLYRMWVNTPNNLVTDNLPTAHMNEEEYILYWTYTDDGGVTHRFRPEAQASADEDGNAVLTDINGNTVTVPAGSTLTGEWIQVSAPVYFFVNYTGTILDTEGDVAGRGGAFLNGTAIGHVFFSEPKAGENGTYAQAVHQEISNMFRSKENLDLEPDGDNPPQILIETATTASGEDLALTNDEAYGEANAKIILEATLSWIQTQEGVNLYISTGNGQTKANADQLTAENYSIRWYVVKEQNDAWHIDGVLTAKTKPLVVTKSFAGLSETQIQSILSGYQIALWIRGNDSAATYMTLEYEQSVDGQYTFDSYDSATQTAQWTVRLLAGEHVTLTEENFALSGYVATEYSVIDGMGESIHTGASTGWDVAQAEGNDVYDVVGGVNGEVDFSNTYTEIGKGSLSILKKNDATGTVMQNVTFTLTDEEGNAVSSDTTDAMGRADFMNLDEGTYTVTETMPPGFAQSTDVITVVVSIPAGQTNATITVYKNGVLEKTGTNSVLYIVDNTPAEGTLLVEKVFKDITAAEVEALKDTYKITLTGEGEPVELTLNSYSYKSADSMRFNWVLDNVGAQTLTVTESGYASNAYIDTVVTAQVTAGGKTTEPEPVINNDDHTASVQITTTVNGTNRVVLTNTYTNEFVLYLRKTDTITGEPLRGAVFKLYGSYEEATNAKDTIKYRDSEGIVHTLYYIGDTEASDENGLAKVSGLNLSNEGKTYAYVLSEIVAPNGYAKPNYPDGIVPPEQVITVTVDDVKNNIYSTSMRNQTIGAPLYVKKLVPNNDLDSGKTYTVEITLSAAEKNVRLANRTYEYYIYDTDGTQIGTVREAIGTQPVGELNLDTCSFTVELTAGQYVMVKDVPIGYTYTVTEIIPDGAGYDCAIVNENGTGLFNNATDTATGTILTVEDEEGNIVDEERNTVTVNNYATVDNAVTDVTVAKVWPDTVGTEAVMDLYRITDGDPATAEKVGFVALSAAMGWTYTWTDLPLYGTGGEVYDYYISEEPLTGYSTGYSGEAVKLTLKDSGTEVWAVHATTATVTVTNTVKDITVTARKEWGLNAPTTTITLELYRKAYGFSAELVGTVTLDGTKNAVVTDAAGNTTTVIIDAKDPWVYTWEGLETKYGDQPYTYYVREVPLDGYNTGYSIAGGSAAGMEELTLADATVVVAAKAEGASTDLSVIVTNTAYYELPQTGGGGNLLLYTIGGTLLLAGCLLYGYLLRRRQERRYTR